MGGGIRSYDYDDAWNVFLSFRAKNIFDIGCNVGVTSLMYAMSPVVERIVLVDPNTLALERAAGNLIRNVSNKTMVYVSAFVGEPGLEEVNFYAAGSGAAGSRYLSHAVTATRQGSCSLVPSITLDALVARTGIVPDLVKIDVEGAEWDVLRGASRTASSGKALFIVEMHSNPELSMATNAERVLSWCNEHYYSCYYLSTMQRMTSLDVISGRGRCHVLLLPQGADLPDGIMKIKQGSSADEVYSTEMLKYGTA